MITASESLNVRPINSTRSYTLVRSVHNCTRITNILTETHIHTCLSLLSLALFDLRGAHPHGQARFNTNKCSHMNAFMTYNTQEAYEQRVEARWQQSRRDTHTDKKKNKLKQQRAQFGAVIDGDVCCVLLLNAFTPSNALFFVCFKNHATKMFKFVLKIELMRANGGVSIQIWAKIYKNIYK